MLRLILSITFNMLQRFAKHLDNNYFAYNTIQFTFMLHIEACYTKHYLPPPYSYLPIFTPQLFYTYEAPYAPSILILTPLYPSIIQHVRSTMRPSYSYLPLFTPQLFYTYEAPYAPSILVLTPLYPSIILHVRSTMPLPYSYLPLFTPQMFYTYEPHPSLPLNYS